MSGFGGRRALRHTRFQWVLAAAAIATAVALPVVLISVGGGVAAHELADLEDAGYQIVVSAAGVHGIADAHALAEEIRGLASVTAASPVLSVAIDAFPPSGATPVLAEGVIPDQFGPTLGPAESGLFPLPLPLGDPTDLRHFANGTYTGPASYDVLVSSPFADAHDVEVGASLPLALTASATGATRYNVTGIFGVPPTALGATGAFAVLVPLSDLQVLTGYANGPAAPVVDAADTVEVSVVGSVATNPSALEAVRAQVQALVPYYGVSSLDQVAQQLEAAAGVLTGFYLALSSVGLIVGLVFLALVLLRRVEASRRSIGIRRALGVPRGAIAGRILLDGAILAAIGGAAGVLGGYLVVTALATWESGAVQEAARLAAFVPMVLAGLVAAVVALSLLAAGVATRAALRVEITEALR
jgi:putative ABC transport system permease protein